MAQFVRPDSDIATGTGWTTSGFARLDEGSPGLGDVASQSSGNPSAFLDKGGSSALDPPGTTGHILRAEWRKASGARTLNGELELWQGTPGTGTLIASLSIADLGTVLQEDSYTLSGTEAGNITDYADLNLRVYYTYTGGGAPSSFEVDWIELELPDSDIIVGTGTGRAVAWGMATAAILSTIKDFDILSKAGPFTRSADNNLYQVTRRQGSTAADQIAIWKSDDNGATWSESAFIDPPTATGTVSPIDVAAIAVGDLLHIIWTPEKSASVRALVYATYNMATETAGASEEVAADVRLAGNVGATEIVVRSDSDIVMTYADDSTEISLYRGTSGSWTKHTDISAPAGFSVPHAAAMAVADNDDVHIFFHGWSSGGSGIKHRVLRADYTFSTMDTVTAGGTSAQLMGQAVISQCRLHVLQREADLDVTAWTGLIEEAPTWSSTVIGTDNDIYSAALGSGLGLFEAGGRTVAVWVRDSDQDIRWSEYDGSWGTEASGADTTINDGALRDWRLFVRGGTVYMGGVSNEGGGVSAYHEFSVGAERSLVCAIGKGYAVAHARATGTVITPTVSARGHAVAYATAQASVIHDPIVLGTAIGYAVASATAQAVVIGVGEEFSGWGIPAGLP